MNLRSGAGDGKGAGRILEFDGARCNRALAEAEERQIR